MVHFLEASALSLAPPQTGYEVYILMEYCSGGGLLDLLNTRLRNRLNEQEVLEIFADICQGVAAMHHLDPPVAHRDLKIENILITAPPATSQKPNYKLCDFGSAKPILSRRSPRSMDELKRLEADLNRSTTLPYRPPEMVDVYQRRVIDEKADIWALGVLLYKLCYYTTPFEENGGGPLAILNVKYRFPSSPPYSERIKGLIASLLVDPSTRRPTIDDLVVQVHKLLGKPPPASATHYAQLSASGKQAEALPRLISQSAKGADSSSSRAVDDEILVKISRESRCEKAVGRVPGSRFSNRPESLALPSDKKPEGARIATGDSSEDLISFLSSSTISDPLEKARETERLMKAEGIEPMRRGRPGATASPARQGIVQATFSIDESKQAAQPRAKPPQPSLVLPSRGNRGEYSPDGFGDSFDPSAVSPAATSAVAAATASISPPPNNRTSQGAEFLKTADRTSDATSRMPVTHTDESSHARKAPYVVSSKQEAPNHTSDIADSSAEGRFPSLEELDRQFPESPIRTPEPESRPHSDTNRPPGAREAWLKRDAPGTINSFGRHERLTPTLPPRKPSPNAINTHPAVLSVTDERKPSSPPPEASRLSAKFGSIKSKPVPPLPTSAALDSSSKQAGGKATETDSSGGEDDGPEEAGASGSVRQRWAHQQQASTLPKQSEREKPQVRPPLGGKIVAPDWLTRSEEGARSGFDTQPSKQAPPLPTAQKPLLNLSQDATPPSKSANVAPAGSPSIPKEDLAAASETTTSTTAAQSRAPAWDWDGEDEEEVRSLRAPHLAQGGAEGSSSSEIGQLIDVSNVEPEPVKVPGHSWRMDSAGSGITAETVGAQKPSPTPEQSLPAQKSIANGDSTAAHGSKLAYSSPSTSTSNEWAKKSSRPSTESPETDVVMVGGHRAYAKGTAQSLASKWETMGGAIHSRPQTANKIPAPTITTSEPDRRASTLVQSSRFPRSAAAPKAQSNEIQPAQDAAKGAQDSTTTLPSNVSAATPPSIIRPAPEKFNSTASDVPRKSTIKPVAPPSSLKPWEREEAERAQVQKYGHSRDLPDSKEVEPNSASSATVSSPVLRSESATGGTEQQAASNHPHAALGDAQNRYKSVASLIDRWQANAQGSGRESGWGQIGTPTPKTRLPGRDV